MHGIIGAGIGIWLFLTGLSGNAVPEYGQVIRQDAGQQPVMEQPETVRRGTKQQETVQRGTVQPGEAGQNTAQQGSDQSESNGEQTPQAIQEELLQSYDFGELDRLLTQDWNVSGYDFKTIVQGLLTGDISEEIGWQEAFYELFLQEIDANKAIMLKLLLLAMITAFFTNLGGAFGKSMIGENGFYVTYLLMTALLLYSFSIVFQLAQDTVEELRKIMETLIPVYIMAVSITSGITSSVVLQEGMVLGLTAVSYGIQRIIFPFAELFVVLGLVNNLMEEDYFSRFGDLIKTWIRWMLKGILAAVVGVNTVKSMLAPAADSVTATALQRGLAIIPGGQAVNTVSGVMIGSGILIKNAIGVGGMLVLIMAVSMPILKMSVFVLGYKLTGVLLQPIADKRMLRGIESVSEGGRILISTVLTVIALFLLSIAIIAVSTNVMYYAG